MTTFIFPRKIWHQDSGVMEEGASLDPNTVGGEGLPDALPKSTSPEEVLTPKDSRPSSPGDGSNNDDSVGKVSAFL